MGKIGKIKIYDDSTNRPLLICKIFYDTIENYEKLLFSKSELYSIKDMYKCRIPSMSFPFTTAKSYEGDNSPERIVKNWWNSKLLNDSYSNLDKNLIKKREAEQLVISPNKQFCAVVFAIPNKKLVDKIYEYTEYEYGMLYEFKTTFLNRYEWFDDIHWNEYGLSDWKDKFKIFNEMCAINIEFSIRNIVYSYIKNLKRVSFKETKEMYNMKFIENSFLISTFIKALTELQFEK